MVTRGRGLIRPIVGSRPSKGREVLGLTKRLVGVQNVSQLLGETEPNHKPESRS